MITCVQPRTLIDSNSAQKMDATGKSKAVAAVLALAAYGQTNLWDGLVRGLEDLSGSAGGFVDTGLFRNLCATLLVHKRHPYAFLTKYADF